MITDTANGTTLLHDCARDGNVDILNLLLDKKVDLNVQDNFGQTALHIGALEGSADIVGLLLEAGANADVRNYNGETAFNVAVRKIYTNPANLYPKTLKDYCESLSISIEEPNAEITWLLLKYTKININDVDMVRAFHWAVNKRHLNIVTLLLHRGMNVNVQYQHRYTALHVALNNNDNDLVEILLDEGADPNIFSPLSFAVSKENVNAVKLLLKRGANLQDRGGIFGSTNFLRAIHGGNKDIVMALLENGADVEMANEEDQKPLHLSIWCAVSLQLESKDENVDIVCLLFKYMKEINVNDKDVIGIFYWAAINGYLQIIKLLLNSGMNVNVQDQHGYTALHRAVSHKNYDVVEYLLENGAYIPPETNSER
ncbi:Ankyrin repeats (3 copies) [Popillia japonica]|uniref:Ankyrin repeats (3 copies) n=1 Tax=Popillia japonica TaxID=7064 RepID=A0AAW1LXK9_POPJA